VRIDSTRLGCNHHSSSCLFYSLSLSVPKISSLSVFFPPTIFQIYQIFFPSPLSALPKPLREFSSCTPTANHLVYRIYSFYIQSALFSYFHFICSMSFSTWPPRSRRFSFESTIFQSASPLPGLLFGLKPPLFPLRSLFTAEVFSSLASLHSYPLVTSFNNFPLSIDICSLQCP